MSKVRRKFRPADDSGLPGLATRALALANEQIRGSSAASLRSLLPRCLAVAVLPGVLYCLVLAHGFHPTQHGQAINMASYYDGFTLSMLNQGSLFSPVFPQMGFPVGARQNLGYPVEVFSAFLVQITGCDPITAHQVFGCLSLIIGYFSLSLLCYHYCRHFVLSLFGPLLFYTSLYLFYFHDFFHLQYSFILVPAYLLLGGAFVQRSLCSSDSWSRTILFAICVFLVFSFAVFLDAYSAVFALAASSVVLGLCLIETLLSKRLDAHSLSRLLLIGVTLAGPLAVYALNYESGARRPNPPMDFLRGRGVDLATVVMPTHEIYWAKFVGVPIKAWNYLSFYGDGGNCRFNYLGVVLGLTAITGLILCWRSQGGAVRRAPLLVGLLGFVLCLGPSLKIYDVGEARAMTGHLTSADYSMPEEAATMTLPTSLLFERTPLASFRVVQRWQILFRCACVVGFVVALAFLARRKPLLAAIVFVFAFVENLPTRVLSLGSDKAALRESFELFKSEVVEPLRFELKPTDRVLFLPARNDYLLPSIAARTGAFAYNSTPDKELARAFGSHPPILRRLRSKYEEGSLDHEALAEAFKSNLLDTLVLTKFPLQHFGPTWPPSHRIDTDIILQQLRGSALHGEELCSYSAKWYVVLRPCSSVQSSQIAVFGQEVAFSAAGKGAYWLGDGFSTPENWGVWTDGPLAEVRMRLERPPRQDLEFAAVVWAYSSDQYPRRRKATVSVNGAALAEWEFEHPPRPELRSVRIPLSFVDGESVLRLKFEIPDATSPVALGLPPHARRLGLAFRAAILREIDGDKTDGQD